MRPFFFSTAVPKIRNYNTGLNVMFENRLWQFVSEWLNMTTGFAMTGWCDDWLGAKDPIPKMHFNALRNIAMTSGDFPQLNKWWLNVCPSYGAVWSRHFQITLQIDVMIGCKAKWKANGKSKAIWRAKWCLKTVWQKGRQSGRQSGSQSERQSGSQSGRQRQSVRQRHAGRQSGRQRRRKRILF